MDGFIEVYWDRQGGEGWAWRAYDAAGECRGSGPLDEPEDASPAELASAARREAPSMHSAPVQVH